MKFLVRRIDHGKTFVRETGFVAGAPIAFGAIPVGVSRFDSVVAFAAGTVLAGFGAAFAARARSADFGAGFAARAGTAGFGVGLTATAVSSPNGGAVHGVATASASVLSASAAIASVNRTIVLSASVAGVAGVPGSSDPLGLIARVAAVTGSAAVAGIILLIQSIVPLFDLLPGKPGLSDRSPLLYGAEARGFIGEKEGLIAMGEKCFF